jgi:hypothetical protein
MLIINNNNFGIKILWMFRILWVFRKIYNIKKQKHGAFFCKHLINLYFWQIE